MALEISEIGIRMRVRDDEEESGERRERAAEPECGDVDREEIVADCVRRVLQLLRTAEER